MINKTMTISMLLMMTSAALAAAPLAQSEAEGKIFQARVYLAQGKLEAAKNLANEVYSENGKDRRAQMLMAEVLEHEIEAEKSAGSLAAHSAEADVDPEVMVSKLLERSRTLLGLRQYDEALLTAEKVFQYDPINSKASRLIDQIKTEGLADRDSSHRALSRVNEEEVKNRLTRYRKEVRESVQQGNWGIAAMEVKKILWLEPNDREALQLEETIKEQLKNEKRKTL